MARAALLLAMTDLISPQRIEYADLITHLVTEKNTRVRYALAAGLAATHPETIAGDLLHTLEQALRNEDVFEAMGEELPWEYFYADMIEGILSELPNISATYQAE